MTAAAAISIAGEIAAFAPPPAGPAVSATLGIVGAVLPMFAGAAPDSDELVAVKKLDAKVEKSLAYQQLMIAKLNEISNDIKEEF